MPWKCPACSTPIRRELIAAGDDTPQPGRVYRCNVCRLDLVLHGGGTHMVVAPLERDEAAQWRMKALDAEHAALVAEHDHLEQEHARLHHTPNDWTSHREHRARLRQHIERPHLHIERYRAERAKIH